MESMNRKVAIVTGASRASGISTAVCLSLAKAGVDVFFTHWTAFDRIEGNGEERDFPDKLCDKIKSFGVRAEHLSLDLSVDEAPATLLNKVKETLGPASILVNNATHESPTDFRNLSIDLLDKHYRVNNRGTLMLSVEFAKQYEKSFQNKHEGRIINLVSGGLDPNNIAYIATKGMTIAITEPYL